MLWPNPRAARAPEPRVQSAIGIFKDIDASQYAELLQGSGLENCCGSSECRWPLGNKWSVIPAPFQMFRKEDLISKTDFVEPIEFAYYELWQRERKRIDGCVCLTNLNHRFFRLESVSQFQVSVVSVLSERIDRLDHRLPRSVSIVRNDGKVPIEIPVHTHVIKRGEA